MSRSGFSVQNIFQAGLVVQLDWSKITKLDI